MNNNKAQGDYSPHASLIPAEPCQTRPHHTEPGLTMPYRAGPGQSKSCRASLPLRGWADRLRAVGSAHAIPFPATPSLTAPRLSAPWQWCPRICRTVGAAFLAVPRLAMPDQTAPCRTRTLPCHTAPCRTEPCSPSRGWCAQIDRCARRCPCPAEPRLTKPGLSKPGPTAPRDRPV